MRGIRVWVLDRIWRDLNQQERKNKKIKPPDMSSKEKLRTSSKREISHGITKDPYYYANVILFHFIFPSLWPICAVSPHTGRRTETPCWEPSHMEILPSGPTSLCAFVRMCVCVFMCGCVCIHVCLCVCVYPSTCLQSTRLSLLH